MARVQNIMKINKSESRIGATKAVQEQLRLKKTKVLHLCSAGTQI